MSGLTLICFLVGILVQILVSEAQIPPRLNIPGAVLLQPAQRPLINRPHRLHQPGEGQIPLRLRKPIPNALPISIPIQEDSEEQEVKQSILDEEVAKFQSAASQSKPDNEEVNNRPVQFRPERPLNFQSQPGRPIFRQDLDDHEEQNVRQPPRQQLRQQNSPAPVRQQKPKPIAYQKPSQHLDDDEDRRPNRNRKPPVQILRKYRTDNDDGSITWGFENEDGTFKEENIGIDCIIRGKYGYVDPEGTRREYSYEAGNKCDHQPEEEDLPELPPQQIVQGKPRKQYNVPLKQ